MSDKTQQLLLKISRKNVALLEFLGIDESLLLRDLQQTIDTRIRDLIYWNQTEEDGMCAFCHVSAMFIGHTKDCKLHPDNLPEELK